MASRSLNKVLVIGNLTRDPEMRYTAKGTPVCVFGVATNRSWKDSASGEQREEAEFLNIVAWNKLAEICYNLLAKGMLVYIEGELRTRSYENANGETIYRTEIVAVEMQLLNDKGKVGLGASGNAPKSESKPTSEDNTSESKESKSEKATAKASDEDDVLDDLVF